jgi:hypothetical protein
LFLIFFIVPLVKFHESLLLHFTYSLSALASVVSVSVEEGHTDTETGDRRPCGEPPADHLVLAVRKLPMDHFWAKEPKMHFLMYACGWLVR